MMTVLYSSDTYSEQKTGPWHGEPECWRRAVSSIHPLKSDCSDDWASGDKKARAESGGLAYEQALPSRLNVPERSPIELISGLRPTMRSHLGVPPVSLRTPYE